MATKGYHSYRGRPLRAELVLVAVISFVAIDPNLSYHLCNFALTYHIFRKDASPSPSRGGN